MEKVAVYVRVSTSDQAKGLLSQKRALRQYLNGHGIENAKWYIDRVSGSATKRRKLDLLRRDIFNGKVKNSDRVGIGSAYSAWPTRRTGITQSLDEKRRSRCLCN